MRKLVVVLAVVLVVASACSSSKKKTTTSGTTATKGAQNIAVQLDGKAKDYNGVFTAFFPNDVSAHPGDTIKFDVPRVNEPHTVTFGTIINDAVNKIDQLGPTASPAAQENSPELLKAPDVFPHKVGNGPPDANQSAAQPCFMQSGVPPLSLTGGAPACPKVAQPDFDGTQAFYNSGVLTNDGDSFSMKLAPSIKPGTYSFMCLIHRGTMTAKLTVAPPAQSIPSPSDQKTKGQQQFSQLESQLKPIADSASQGNASDVKIGLGDPKVFNALVAQFGPKDVSIPVGGTVTWNMFLFHSLSFGFTAADVGAFTKASDGSIHLSEKSGPINMNVPPAAFAFPPADNASPIALNSSYGGTGQLSTGIVGSVPPALITTKITFPKAGTYQYRCLFHRDMEGTIKVG